jgi:hypothetical protein
LLGFINSMAEAVNTAASAVRDEVAIDLCSHEVDIQRTESKASKMMKSCSTSSLSEHHVTSCATQPIAINAYQREPDRSKTEMCSTADAVPDGVCERDVETIARLEALEERSNGMP